MNRNSKSRKPLIRLPAYRQAFERLDKALSKNTRSDCDERKKNDMLRLELFGCLAE
jgi:hypothetical protein